MTAGSSDDIPFRPSPDGLLLRENFTPERMAWFRAQAEKAGGGNFLSDEARRESRRAFLAEHPPGEDLWVFGYGSLMWNPAVHVCESRTVRVTGYRRSFCLHLMLGRATPERPGLMLALEEGGACAGVAHRIASDHVESETDILWMREMLTGAYTPRWVEAHFEDGPRAALTFIINKAHPRYAGALPVPEIARRIAHAEGLTGTNRDYLFRTAAHLRELGVADAHITEIEEAVKALAPP